MITALFIIIASMLGDVIEGSHIFPLKLEDSLGHSRILRIGVHPEATYRYDTTFGEIAIPPIPSVPVFDARLLDLPGRSRFPGTGSKVDIRCLSSSAQSDTFIVKFQPAEGRYPIILSWPEVVAREFKRATIVYEHDGAKREIDMLSMNTITFSDDSVVRVMVILSGPKSM